MLTQVCRAAQWRKGQTFGVFVCFFFFLIMNLFFIGVQFANIQNSTQCSSRQVPPSVPVTIHPHPPPSSPSTTPLPTPGPRLFTVLRPVAALGLQHVFSYKPWSPVVPACPSTAENGLKAVTEEVEVLYKVLVFHVNFKTCQSRKVLPLAFWSAPKRYEMTNPLKSPRRPDQMTGTRVCPR